MAESIQKYLNINEACSLLKIGRREIQKLCAEGVIQTIPNPSGLHYHIIPSEQFRGHPDWDKLLRKYEIG